MAFADPHLSIDFFPSSSSSYLREAHQEHLLGDAAESARGSGRTDHYSKGAELLLPIPLPDDSHGLSIASQRTAGDLGDAAYEGGASSSSCSRLLLTATAAATSSSGISASPWTPLSVVVVPSAVQDSSSVKPTRLSLQYHEAAEEDDQAASPEASAAVRGAALARLCAHAQQHQAACKASLGSVVAKMHAVVQQLASMSTTDLATTTTTTMSRPNPVVAVPLDVSEAIARERLLRMESDERNTLLCAALHDATAEWNDACKREAIAVEELAQLLADAEQEAQETVARATSGSFRSPPPSSSRSASAAAGTASSTARKSGVRRSRHYLTLAASMAAGLADSKSRFEAELREGHQQEIQRLCAEFEGKLERRRLGEHALREEIFSLRCQLAQAYGTLTPPSLSLEDLMQTPFVQTHVQREIDRRASRASGGGSDEGIGGCLSPLQQGAASSPNAHADAEEVVFRGERTLSNESCSQDGSFWSAGAAACKRRQMSTESVPSDPRRSQSGGGYRGTDGFVAFDPLADTAAFCGASVSPCGRPSLSPASCGGGSKTATTDGDGH